ncbi:MAG: protease modulator HflC [Rhodospirillaceae bacterium]|jgi:modulator of FtsH protease HflC|nr:protease modulator HflC [Rhodospirillaceae bacterium]MBT7266886.1 protease modulator HflC [Rhodospirillaceae bacterium]
MNKVVLAVIGVVVVVAGVLASASLFTVHQTQQALVLQFGNPVRVESTPGLKVKLPFVQNVTFYDRRILDLDPPAQEIILNDQKRINVDSFVRYKIIDPLEFLKTAQTDANFRQIFGGRLNATVRSEVGKVLLGDMLSNKRDDVMHRITAQLKLQAPQFGIEVVDVRIGRTDLPETTSQSVYNRMRSQRVAEAAKLRAQGAELKAKTQAEADRDRTIILAEAQKQAQILRGQGEGSKTVILNEAFGKDQEFFEFYRSMEAYNEAFGEGTTMVLSPDSDFFKFFGNMTGKKSAK